MPIEEHTIIRTCRDCGKPDGEVKFDGSRKACVSCRSKRNRFLAINPDAARLPRRKPGDLWGRLLAHRSIDANGCWNWTAYRGKQGYGHIVNVQIPTTKKRAFGVHRLVAHLVYGLDLNQRNDYACHYCDNPACFNPEHIFVGTPKDNMQDCKAKGRERHQPGEENGGGGKLTETDVRDIRRLLAAGHLQRKVAECYSVDQTMVSRIELRKAWAHVA